MRHIPILMYHSIDDGNGCKSCVTASEQLYSVKKVDFASQIQYLSTHGFHSILFDDLDHLQEIPNKTIIITFDDGHKTDYTTVLPILLAHNFRAIFFITTDWIDSENYLSSDDIRIMAAHSMCIGSHSHTHPFFNEINEEKFVSELVISKNILDEITMQSIDSFSFPGGRTNMGIFPHANRVGYKYLCTSAFGYVADNINYNSMPRIAIKSSTSLEDFIRIVNVDTLYIFKRKCLYFILNNLKIFLGNTLYANFHNVFSRFFMK